jgi:ribonuclease BN (tRNA processing enzyme)
MKIRVLGASGGEGLGLRPSAFLVNDRILIDGGTVTSTLSVPEQLEIEHALVSHSHLDHIAGLAYLAETLACCGAAGPVTITSLEPIVKTLKTGVFNNAIWPDFAAIPTGAPVIRYRTLVEDVEQRVGELWVTPVGVSHTVPTAGFIVHDGETGLIYSGDTGPTDALWKAAKGLRGIRAIILECAFPNRLGDLAELAKHMTPELIRQELDKLPPDVPVWIFHVKPQFFEETSAELEQVAAGRVSIIEQDKTYQL